jgi:hypothetical protein
MPKAVCVLNGDVTGTIFFAQSVSWKIASYNLNCQWDNLKIKNQFKKFNNFDLPYSFQIFY